MAGFVTHRFYGFRGFVGVYFRFCGFFPSFVVSWFHRFRCVKGFVVTDILRAGKRPHGCLHITEG